MGFARITAGGELGRYTIELDYGEAQRVANLAEAGQAVEALLLRIAAQQIEVDKADTEENEIRAAIISLINDLASDPTNSLLQGLSPAFSPLLQLRKRLIERQGLNQPIRDAMNALKGQLAEARRRVAQWNTVSTTQTKDAWCVDLTENGPVGSYVSTVDIPGDPSLVLVSEGCRPWATGDGLFVARELTSPELAFFNAAIFPGWQKFKPTYRWGTITSLTRLTHTCSVTIAPASSTAQRLDVNQQTALVNVPITYMTCDSGAFSVGDRVIVKFEGQDWANPRVIGFLDNPRPCGWACVGNSGGSSYFEAGTTNEIYQYLTAALDIRVRIDGGSWQAMDLQEAVPGLYSLFRIPLPANPFFSLVQVLFFTTTEVPFPGASPRGQAYVSVRPPEPRNTGLVTIAEVAAYIGGQPTFNVATTDTDDGFVGTNVSRVKAPGGIRNRYGIYFPCTPLTYTLLTET